MVKSKLPNKYLQNSGNIPQICTVPNNLDFLSGLFLTRISEKMFCQSATLYYTWNLSVLRMIEVSPVEMRRLVEGRLEDGVTRGTLVTRISVRVTNFSLVNTAFTALLFNSKRLLPKLQPLRKIEMFPF